MDTPSAPQHNGADNKASPPSSAPNTTHHMSRSLQIVLLLGGVFFLIIIGGVVLSLASGQKGRNTQTPPADYSQQPPPQMGPAEGTMQQGQTFEKLSEPEVLFSGGYADPTILKKSDGSLIMYLNNFSKQPATYQAYTSQDGKKWTLASAKLPNASTGRIVSFGTTVRLYYPDRTPIRPTDPPASILSAVSTDGFTFTKEPGPRVSPLDGYYLEGPTVFKAGDSYRMYFSENETASPEKRISKIWGATSEDGKTWTRDSNPTIEANEKDEHIPPGWPQALHPFVLTRPNGTYLMFYNTHSEVYAASSTDGTTWTKLGSVGIHGADVDGYYLPDGSIRLYYGDFSEQTSGVIYTVDIKEI